MTARLPVVADGEPPRCAAAGAPPPRAVDGEVQSNGGPVPRLSTAWSWRDRRDHLRCRLGSFRNRYAVAPGLYAVGAPGRDAEVLVSANYGLSLDVLRRSLRGLDAWLLVLDTRGVNVWCAAGKGTFGTAELVHRIGAVSLHRIVAHRRLIVPQLGAPGVAAHEVQRATGFRVHFGPVRAADLPAFLRAGRVATPEMRRVRFPLTERVVLIPMELIPALKWLTLLAVALAALSAIVGGQTGAWTRIAPWLALSLGAVLAGAVIAPLAMPLLPGRAFSVKGWLAGLPITAALIAQLPAVVERPLLVGASILFFPALSAFLALQFTGSATFTGISGVRREMRLAIPIQAASAVVAIALLVIHAVGAGGAP